MNKAKVNDFVRAYARALNLSTDTTDILIDLMETIIVKYEAKVPHIYSSSDPSSVYLIKPVDGKYSVEDFFLNRLMRNIWSVNEITPEHIREGFASIHTKGYFDPSLHEVSFNTAKLETQVDKYKNLFGENFDRMKEAARRKVIMHEFEHGLQTRFKPDVLDFNTRESYRKISDEIEKLGKYSSSIQTYETFPKGFYSDAYLSTGTHYSSLKENEGLTTYRNVEGFDNLNEILNESESLEMAPRLDAKWWHVNSDNNNIIFIRNPESSNSSITNYGDLFKMLLGGANSFLLMYLEPSEGFRIFNNQYNDIFQSVYGSSKDAVELFITAITKIKEEGLEEDHLKLNYALAKCLEKKINSFSQNPNVKTSTMLHTINLFQVYTLSNLDEEKKRNLEHRKVLEELKKQVNDRQIETSQEKTEEPNNLPPIPTFEEIHQLASRYDLIVDDNNQSNVQVTDRVNGNTVTDKDEIANAIFANIWLQSAGIKKNPIEDKGGEDYAFSEQSRNLYNFFVRSVEHSLGTTGNIDSVSIFKNAELLNYKHSQEVISNLFRSDYQANFMDDFFRKRYSLDKEKSANPQTLYNLFYASDIAYGDEEETKVSSSMK